MVKKSALTLFKGEWVVFVEKEHEEASHNDEKSDHEKEETHEHDDHGHDAHKEDKEHEDHETETHNEEEEEHGHDESKEELPYEAKVVHVIAYAGEYVAVEGLKAEEEYVSDGVYFVKSMILKSSLGEHGH